MNTKQQLSNAVDEALLKAVTQGETVLDSEGNLVQVSPSAKMIEVAIKRLSQLGINNEVISTGKQADLIRELRSRGTMRISALPPINDDGEDRVSA
jgi:hypothetical protein